MKKFVILSLFIVVVSAIVPAYADKAPDAEVQQAEQEVLERLKNDLRLASVTHEKVLQIEKDAVKLYILKKLNEEGYTKGKVGREIEKAKWDLTQRKISIPNLVHYVARFAQDPDIQKYIDSLLR